MGRPIHKEDAMGNEFTGFEDNAPTLTLEPDLGEPKADRPDQQQYDPSVRGRSTEENG